MLAVLPEVIYHLESFDALLVRSSITNYLVAQAASDYVPAVFSGEGGDELFAGYEYLKSLEPEVLPDELIDITGRLHNTALQRVDRCAAAHGTLAHVAFLDPDVAAYALQIPIEYKLRDGIEKWILRRAMDGALPERVLNRTKAKFWAGAGVGDLLARYADAEITELTFVGSVGSRTAGCWTARRSCCTDEAARGHLAAATYLQMALKPHIVHVVGHTEAHHAATAEDVVAGCKVARRAIENAVAGAPDMTADPRVQARKQELIAEAELTLDAIRALAKPDVPDPLTDPATLARAVTIGILDAPHLRNNRYACGRVGHPHRRTRRLRRGGCRRASFERD